MSLQKAFCTGLRTFRRGSNLGATVRESLAMKVKLELFLMEEDTPSSKFDREFFEHFYSHPATCASNPKEFRRLSAFVLSYLTYLEIPVRSVVDLGCGLGRWKDVLEEYDPRIRYTGVDVSPYLCREYGWRQASVENFTSGGKYDLVICQDVLPYLSKERIPDAVSNIAGLCRGAAYIQVITKEDWDKDICDPKRTDATMHRFSAAWYQSLLSRHFKNCGGGMFVPKEGATVVWELEHLWR